MQFKLIGGPYDGGTVDVEGDGICVPLDSGRVACYYRISSDIFKFTPDGNYHFYKIVNKDDLEKIE